MKYDYCYKPQHERGDQLYQRMAMALNNSGRDILLAACSWGADETETWIKSTGAGSWRSTVDIVIRSPKESLRLLGTYKE